MTEPRPEDRRDPPTPDRRAPGPGTWIWILLVLVLAAAVILWGAYAGLPPMRSGA